MTELPSDSLAPRRGPSRRDWLAAVALGSLGPLPIRADEPKAASAIPQNALAAIMSRAKAAKLRGFEISHIESYYAVGDARGKFRDRAIQICRALSTAYLKHFREKGFTVALPEHKLAVITLKNKNSYTAFVGEAPGLSVGGHYDLNSNELVIFDFRPEEGDVAPAASPERINTFTLVHEALHQLTFNTGLLDREHDVPLGISEGLAMYGELWQPPPVRAQLGTINKPRLDALTEKLDQGAEWIALDRLLTEDALFEEARTQQLAYAQGWLLVHFLLSRPKLPRFRAYLGAIRARRGNTQRLNDAKTHLGDLARLDGELRHRAGQLT